MRKSHRIGFGVLCLLSLFAAPFASSDCTAWSPPHIRLVTPDTNPPVILSVVASCRDLTTITVTYSEPMQTDPATDTFNYFVQDSQSNEAHIISAVLVDSRIVLLQVFIPLVPGNSYTLETEFCMPDLAGNCLELRTIPIVFDTTPPEVTCSVAIGTIFPPNNALVNVGLTPAAAQVQVYSDEPELPSLADATYQNGVLKLRTRRDPGADGRVYLIVITSTDACGNVGVCCTTVVVPKNGSPAALSSVQAQAAAAQGQCSPTGSPLTPHLVLP